MHQQRFSAQQKRECAARETGMRRRVYPNWVANGRMKEDEATRQIDLMNEIAGDYEFHGVVFSIPDAKIDELRTALWHARQSKDPDQVVFMEREMLRRFIKDNFGDRYEPPQSPDLFEEPAK